MVTECDAEMSSLKQLQQGIGDMDAALEDLEILANHYKYHITVGATDEDEENVLKLCNELTRSDSVVARLLVIQDNCHKAALGLYADPDYGLQARYCIASSLHAAEFGSNTGELAEMLRGSLQRLRDRARKQDQKKWDLKMEEAFWKAYDSRLDSLARVYTPGPKPPNYIGLIRPNTDAEKTCISYTLDEYLKSLEKIPKHYRTILDYLDKVCVKLSRKHYGGFDWYKGPPSCTSLATI